MAGAMLDGARPYVDFVDPNPPLVLLLNVPAVALAARLAALAGGTLYVLCTALLAAGCLALALRVLRRGGIASDAGGAARRS